MRIVGVLMLIELLLAGARVLGLTQTLFEPRQHQALGRLPIAVACGLRSRRRALT